MRPFVDVHPCVQTARLFEFPLGLAGWREGISRHRIRREEAIRVEVTTANRVALDNGIRVGAAQSQRCCRMPNMLRGSAIDHGPLVKSEAGEVWRPGQSAREQVPDELHRWEALCGEGAKIQRHRPVAETSVVRPSGTRLPGGVFQNLPWSRMPPTQFGHREVVVLEEEVLDRVFTATASALGMAGGQGISALLMGDLAGLPLVPAQSIRAHWPTVPADPRH